MNTKNLLLFALGEVLLVGCLTGCSTSRDATTQPETTFSQETDASAQIAVAFAENNASPAEASYEELFKPYEPFGLTYNSSEKELQYQGKAVRWFEDYYTIEDGTQVGNDFFNENGVIDVYAVRDFSNIVPSDDGSFDPGGKLIGIKEFSEEEFSARDIEAIKNPAPNVAIAGNPSSEKVLEDRAKEYEEFGVTYDVINDQWYFNGEKVRFFRDVLTSNGEELTSGKFKGTIRTLGSADGTVDIYTIRDFTNLDTFGNGTLIDIKKYSQTEFEEHTQKELQSSSGFCTSTED